MGRLLLVATCLLCFLTETRGYIWQYIFGDGDRVSTKLMVISEVPSNMRMCLDWWGSSVGSPLRMAECSLGGRGGNENHQIFSYGWYLNSPGNPRARATPVVFFKDWQGRMLCLDSLKDYIYNNDPVSFWYCNGGSRQHFYVEDWRIYTYSRDGVRKCVNVPGWNAVNGQHMIFWDCNFGDNHGPKNEMWRWVFAAKDAGYRAAVENNASAVTDPTNGTAPVDWQVVDPNTLLPNISGYNWTDDSSVWVDGEEDISTWPWILGVAISSLIALTAIALSTVFYFKWKRQMARADVEMNHSTGNGLVIVSDDALACLEVQSRPQVPTTPIQSSTPLNP